MGKCPVCNKNTRQLQCPGCGFDGSCNYERYPSLGNLPRATESVNARRAALAEKQADSVRPDFADVLEKSRKTLPLKTPEKTEETAARKSRTHAIRIALTILWVPALVSLLCLLFSGFDMIPFLRKLIYAALLGLLVSGVCMKYGLKFRIRSEVHKILIYAFAMPLIGIIFLGFYLAFLGTFIIWEPQMIEKLSGAAFIFNGLYFGLWGLDCLRKILKDVDLFKG